MSAELTTLLKRVRAQGWTACQANNGHYDLTSPLGRRIQIALTPSDHRTRLNEMSRLRRMGFRDSGDLPDEGREERMTKAAEGVGQAQLVLEELQRRPGVARNAPSITKETGLPHKSVAATLSWLVRNHPEVQRPEHGFYRWTPAKPLAAVPDEPEPEVPESVPAEAEAPAEATNGHAGLWTKEWTTAQVDPPAPTNGHLDTSTALATLADVAEAELVIRTPAEPRLISVVPAALPTDLPTMFEAVTTDGAGHIILRDEQGGIWMAVPMRPAL